MIDYVNRFRQKEKISACREAGFGLIEALVALAIISFVFSAFTFLMMRAISTTNRSNVQSDMSMALGNRIEMSWVDGHLDTNEADNIHYSIENDGLILTADQAKLEVHEERIIDVEPAS